MCTSLRNIRAAQSFGKKRLFILPPQKRLISELRTKLFTRHFFCHIYIDQNNRYFLTKFSTCIQNMNTHVCNFFQNFLSFGNMFFENGVDAHVHLCIFPGPLAFYPRKLVGLKENSTYSLHQAGHKHRLFQPFQVIHIVWVRLTPA